jgi:hypothetical protein
MEQWSSGRWSTHNWFRLWRNGCAGAKGGGVCTTGLAQVRFGTGTKGAGIGAQLWSNRAVGAGLRAIGLGYGEMGARNEAIGAGLGEIGFSYRALGARLRAIGFDSGQMIKRNCGYGF